MPTYAILGATGSTGSAILRCLLLNPPKDLILNVFVRSASKFRKAFPDLGSTTAFKTNIIEGVPTDAKKTQECLKDVDVIMACIASNNSTPGMTLCYDTATAIINALTFHQKALGASYKMPTIIQLRSASINPLLKARQPWIAQTMSSFCFYYCYEDLRRTCDLYASTTTDSPGLIEYIFIDPPSIHDADGTTPTGHKLILDEPQEQALSYADLGVGFCEAAERRVEFAGKGVGVTATGKVNLTFGTLMGYAAIGAKGRIWG